MKINRTVLIITPIITFALILSIFICLTACEAAGPTPPIELPFAVHKAGATVSTEMTVKEAHRYWFELIFLHNKADDEAERERLEKVIGGWGRDKEGKRIKPGMQIPLKISINVIEQSREHTVFEKEMFLGDLWAGGYHGYCREIGYIEIPAGRCRITVQSMKDIPELANSKVILAIRYQSQGKY